jgi:hypothetical protein
MTIVFKGPVVQNHYFTIAFIQNNCECSNGLLFCTVVRLACLFRNYV